MKKCSRCLKEKPYSLQCMGLNKAGLKSRAIHEADGETPHELDIKCKVVSLLLCSDCILSCDLALKGCGHCDMKCSFQKYMCPTYLAKLDKVETDLHNGIKPNPEKLAFYNIEISEALNE